MLIDTPIRSSFGTSIARNPVEINGEKLRFLLVISKQICRSEYRHIKKAVINYRDYFIQKRTFQYRFAIFFSSDKCRL